MLSVTKNLAIYLVLILTVGLVSLSNAWTWTVELGPDENAIQAVGDGPGTGTYTKLSSIVEVDTDEVDAFHHQVLANQGPPYFDHTEIEPESDVSYYDSQLTESATVDYEGQNAFAEVEGGIISTGDVKFTMIYPDE
ncbi:hypothetical protein K8I28_11750 [bacterium]|nr:hypothetical protein [bacterium]